MSKLYVKGPGKQAKKEMSRALVNLKLAADLIQRELGEPCPGQARNTLWIVEGDILDALENTRDAMRALERQKIKEAKVVARGA